jgi:hypothetical protein
MAKANTIIHEFIILDASSSMQGHTSDVIKVTDALISHLASQVNVFPDQETRISVYAFSSGDYLDGKAYQCLIWDKDVLRVPSIAGIYKPHGNTALTATMMQVIEDMKGIPVQYGDHTFLGMLVTDGHENWSQHQGNIGLEKWYGKASQLPVKISGLPDTWTMAGLVPGVTARQQLTRFGFASGNVEIWDPSKKDSILEVGERIRDTSVAYASAVSSSGLRSTTSLFSMASPSKTDLTKTLTPMTPGSYFFEEVDQATWDRIENGRIDQFMALKTGKPYVPGRAYYQMTKRERIQYNKPVAVAVPDHKTREVSVYVGDSARQQLGLPASSEKRDVRVSPGKWKGYKVFVMTTSLNRKLVPGTQLLVMR